MSVVKPFFCRSCYAIDEEIIPVQLDSGCLLAVIEEINADNGLNGEMFLTRKVIPAGTSIKKLFEDLMSDGELHYQSECLTLICGYGALMNNDLFNIEKKISDSTPEYGDVDVNPW